MRVVITGGPSSEPIDEVRVLTNTSTGELAVTLYDRFINAGHEVDLLLGEGARYRRAAAQFFDRNETLARMLAEIARAYPVDLVLHAAALADFSVAPVDAAGAPLAAAKIPSRGEAVCLLLVPKPKIISQLREFFHNAYLVGWKLEHDGDRASLIETARQQVRANRLNACVVNGRAYGPGLGFCTEAGLVHGAPDKAAFADFMASFATRRFQT
jgi:phosphopantothenoylcysteine decarboxylase/phosphopantothenate--cysteine ligase